GGGHRVMRTRSLRPIGVRAVNRCIRSRPPLAPFNTSLPATCEPISSSGTFCWAQLVRPLAELAVNRSLKRVPSAPSPRSSERGPIEANDSTRTGDWHFASLHAHRSVAPLKRGYRPSPAVAPAVSTLIGAWPH